MAAASQPHVTSYNESISHLAAPSCGGTVEDLSAQMEAAQLAYPGARSASSTDVANLPPNGLPSPELAPIHDHRGHEQYRMHYNLLKGYLQLLPVSHFSKVWQTTLDKPEGSTMHSMGLAGLDVVSELSSARRRDVNAMWKKRKCSDIWKALLGHGLLDMCATFLAHQSSPEPVRSFALVSAPPSLNACRARSRS